MFNINHIRPKDENGDPHGEWISYHRNGKLWYRVNYVHGVMHGLYEAYYIDGELMYHSNYVMDKLVGYSCFVTQKYYYLYLI